MSRGRLPWWLTAIILSAVPFVSASSDAQRFAGEEVARVEIASVRHWQVIGASELVIEAPGQAYLLEVGGTCASYDLRDAAAVKLPSPSRTQYLERGGGLVVNDRRCTIQRIRTFDLQGYSGGT